MLPEVIHSYESSQVPRLGAEHVHLPADVLVILENCPHLHLTLLCKVWEWKSLLCNLGPLEGSGLPAPKLCLREISSGLLNNLQRLILGAIHETVDKEPEVETLQDCSIAINVR